MAFVTFAEIVDVVLMTVAVGYIFMDLLQSRKAGYNQEYDPLHVPGFDWHALWLSCLITAPGIVLHEAFHKITALLFGLGATFHASWSGLVIGIVLKAVHSPFVFFVPGYVAIQGAIPFQTLWIAFFGPAMNGLLYLIGYLVTEHKSHMKLSQYRGWMLFRKINGFLFIFNLLPIPGFDGFTVLYSLLQVVGFL